jgi:hypothetical protein
MLDQYFDCSKITTSNNLYISTLFIEGENFCTVIVLMNFSTFSLCYLAYNFMNYSSGYDFFFPILFLLKIMYKVKHNLTHRYLFIKFKPNIFLNKKYPLQVNKAKTTASVSNKLWSLWSRICLSTFMAFTHIIITLSKLCSPILH